MTSTPQTLTCACCHGEHVGPALSYGAHSPDLWREDYADDAGSRLDSDLCVIKGQAFFIHGLIEIPVRDTGEVFSWGVWGSLSTQSFQRTLDRWEAPDRDQDPSSFSWLSTELSIYGTTTVNLKTHVHTRALGQRPFIELEPSEHPLAVEQREGITSTRLAEIADLLRRQDKAAR